ncbi:phosphotransferase enzyme family protein [Aquicella lusitana]|uniref:Ser/Thr protein kinase RdoA (MazF antagonist) n=1 Tax=Aquicella lusitana TaxID=254246 RepID=A0A370GFF2_9COXI|nr:phosphotransferase [Aquicella lusitana]RDI42542.1 Ser/Thr protein kinase RdoA (MazF antagonist) [Aquicella lusitana]VVC74321.1 Homoserine kinase [Aquicella lusitana]
MWEETLKQINHSVTPRRAAALWGDVSSLQLASDGINLVYRFECNKKGRYLRITHPRIRTREALASALDFQKHLYEFDVPICQPLSSLQGNYIEEVKQEDKIFLAHVNEEVAGNHIHFNHEDISIYQTWGMALAKLHRAAAHYQPATGCSFLNWLDLWKDLDKYVQAEDEAVRNEYHQISQWFLGLPQNTDIFGLTHGDHRTGNVLYDGNHVFIIDFDEPVYHWFCADIARPFLELDRRKFMEWQPKLGSFLNAYASIFHLDHQLIKSLPWFIRMKNLEMYLWTKHNWLNPVAPGGGSTANWLNEMRQVIDNPVYDWNW